MDVGSIGQNTISDFTSGGVAFEGEFQEALEMLAATQMVGMIQDALSYSEKQMQKKKEEDRQEGY